MDPDPLLLTANNAAFTNRLRVHITHRALLLHTSILPPTAELYTQLSTFQLTELSRCTTILCITGLVCVHRLKKVGRFVTMNCIILFWVCTGTERQVLVWTGWWGGISNLIKGGVYIVSIFDGFCTQTKRQVMGFFGTSVIILSLTNLKLRLKGRKYARTCANTRVGSQIEKWPLVRFAN